MQVFSYVFPFLLQILNTFLIFLCSSNLLGLPKFNKDFIYISCATLFLPFSMSHDPDLKGAPHGFTLPVQRVILNAGAGFLVVTTGAIMRMPGLPKKPAAYTIDVVDGKITGLS